MTDSTQLATELITRDFWQGKAVLLTGGAGFIGSHVVQLLADVGATITIIDTFTTGQRTNIAAFLDQITLVEQDIRTLDWDQYLAENNFDVILHLAANGYVPPSVENPTFDYELNFATTFRLLEALRRRSWPGRLIFISTAAVYGNPVRIPISEDDQTVPISPYGVGKLAAERYVAVFSQLYNLKMASLRFFSVYGPRQRKQVIFDLLAKLSRNREELFIHGDGTQVRDFLYVEDAARSVLLVAERGTLTGEVYNVATGEECTIGQLAASLCTITGLNPKFLYSGPNRPGDPDTWVVNIDRLRSLGYQPQMHLEQGLANTVAWYQQETGETWA